VRSDWNEGIEPWRFRRRNLGRDEARKIHTHPRPQPVPRRPDGVDEAHRARAGTVAALPIPTATLPTELVIRHAAAMDEFRQPLNWDAGRRDQQWKIPDSAKRGTYQIDCAQSGTGARRPTPASSASPTSACRSFRQRAGRAGALVAPREVPLALGLSFLNGGAAKGAKVEVSTTLRPRWPEYKNYEGLHFIVDFDEEGRSAFAVDDGRERNADQRQQAGDARPKAGAGKLDVALPRKSRGRARSTPR
jgi:hypothetical protein